MNLLFKILIALGGIYLFLIIILYLFQGQMLFLPEKEHFRSPQSLGLDAEDVLVETEDGLKIHGWYFSQSESDFVVVLSHGNAGNISGRLEIAEMLLDLGISVLMYDYRGYGKSEGRPSEKELYNDIDSVIGFLTERMDYKESQIILYGRSLGGAVSAYGAANHTVGGLVLDSAFKDIKSMASDIYPIVPTFLVRLNFSTINFLNSIENTPLLILHSRDDEIVGFHHGEELYEAASEPKKFVPLRGGHNDLFFTSNNTIKRSWQEFLERIKKD
ncbi:alpha/beta hydrolase [Rhodohalobacter barkolensis]|uniref:Alpha/beta hydrolase n=1 Tax=Rhodohalobacter barkolensis TaxID=2053187 RepID=A0A2N0VG62_9BACT|nr:alpha/beta hydrolase [Rhodohalobacter barkolensis]PKD43150.1 alpha/beta hydrolase [Rhodohalobacter barkolensis]